MWTSQKLKDCVCGKKLCFLPKLSSGRFKCIFDFEATQKQFLLAFMFSVHFDVAPIDDRLIFASDLPALVN